ncbi:hypothetical protein Bca52824_025303 [Brassica carinata]|uniref:Reverse transcriptase zinc-binding domain-containing protein n=1 Tax=Brassica carinata TaxID=52824 RepID=A0A8X7VM29_BRACI|nr:hypothetical protein Bca52824_025303 [Brassica carinata]
MFPPDQARGADRYLWRNGADHFVPKFSSKATWHRIRETAPTVPWVDLIWFKEEIPRCSFVAWMAILSRLPTKDRLYSWGINVHTLCVLCFSGQESHQHLFFTCPFVLAVWSHFSGSSWQAVPPSMLAVADIVAVSPRLQVVVKLLMQNSRIFRQVASSEAGVIALVDRMIRDRLLSIAPSRPESPALLQLFLSLTFRPP